MMNEAGLRDKKLFVLDMDGTFYLGGRILEGSAPFLSKVRNLGKSFLFYTNNSSKNAEFYQKKLAGMGCPITERQILTSGDVTTDYLRRVYPGKSVFLLGTPELAESFEKAGIQLEENDPDLVVLGFDLTLRYEKVNRACSLIRAGKPFIATHPDLNCPTEEGFIPDCGAMTAMITASTGVKPVCLGKPYRETLNAILHLTGFSKDEIVFVGDRLYTDIAIGSQNGVTSVLVLTGETTAEEARASAVKPDFILPSLKELAEIL